MIAAILPCRGRVEQTIANVRRLLDTAGAGVMWHLWCVVDNDPEAYRALGVFGTGEITRLTLDIDRKSGYWSAMELATDEADAPLICNLANDLLPGRDWLARGLAEYRCCFGQGDGLMGFNDGIHGPELSPHFLISRGLLDRLGGWPTWYQHNYGDAELCARAQELGMYGKAPWAVLYHDHPFIGGGENDSVYAEATQSNAQDAALFVQRRAQRWPHVSP